MDNIYKKNIDALILFKRATLEYIEYIMKYAIYIEPAFVSFSRDVDNYIPTRKYLENIWNPDEKLASCEAYIIAFTTINNNLVAIIDAISDQNNINKIRHTTPPTIFDTIVRSRDMALEFVSAFSDFDDVSIVNEIIAGKPLSVPELFEELKAAQSLNIILAQRVSLALASSETSSGQAILISSYMESLKDKALDTRRIKGELICRYGLTPDGPFVPKDKATIGPSDAIIDRTSKSSIEFDLRGLLDRQYIVANNLITQKREGLTITAIEKLTTAKFLGSSKQEAPKIINASYASENIYETIDGGNHYRKLKPYDGSLSIVSSLTGMIEGITTRPQDYNKKHEKIILSHGFDTKIMNYVKEYDNIQQMSSATNLKDYVSHHMINSYTDVIRDGIVNGAIVSRDTFRRAILNKNRIIVLLTETLVKSNINNLEVSISNLIQFNSLAGVFIVEFTKALNVQTIEKQLFDRSSEWVVKQLVSVLELSVNSTTTELEKMGVWKNYGRTLKYFVFSKYSN